MKKKKREKENLVKSRQRNDRFPGMINKKMKNLIIVLCTPYQMAYGFAGLL